MAKIIYSISLLFVFILISSLFFSVPSEAYKFAPALYVFGDSLVDVGNNNNYHTRAKSNYLPYGIDFPEGASGRVTNGYNMADMIALSLGLELIPPYRSVNVGSYDSLEGFNYASSSSGILTETGIDMFSGVISLGKQINKFQGTIQQHLQPRLVNQSSIENHLSKSIFFLVTGVNDFALNLLRNEKRSNRLIDYDGFSKDLVERYAIHLESLYKLGARKFVVFDVEALGCLPYVVNKAFTEKPECLDELNSIVYDFNQLLYQKVQYLGSQLQGTTFTIGKYYDYTLKLVQNPRSFGLEEGFKPCCQVTQLGICDAKRPPCKDRKHYAFFDAFHPTQAAYKIIASQCFSGSGVCSPLNVLELAQI